MRLGFIPANHILGEFYEFGSAGEKNPGKAVTRLLVVMLHPRDAKELVIPEKN